MLSDSMERYRILAVEDSATYRSVYEKVFKPERFDLLLLKEGREVLAEAAKLQPHLIVMDVHLPDANGVDLCRQLYRNESTREIAVIVVTSEGDINTLVRAYEAGALDFIRKPFNHIELLIRIENIIRLVVKHNENVKLKQDVAIAEMGRSVAHYVNQPLTSILGAAEMIQFYRQTKTYDPEMQELLDMIINGSHEVAKLVQRIENVKEYKVVDYIRDLKIVDLEED